MDWGKEFSNQSIRTIDFCCITRSGNTTFSGLRYASGDSNDRNLC